MFDQNAAGDAAEQEIRNHLNPCLYFSSTNLLISLFIFLHIISGDAAVQEIRNHLHPQFVPLHITTKKDFQFPKKKIASHHNKEFFSISRGKIQIFTFLWTSVQLFFSLKGGGDYPPIS